jgi:signal transduction histidine kinase
VRKDGTRFWALAVLDAVRDENGALIGFAKITRDITERRDAERRLAEAREQLFQSQKLETIGRLTGGVAHDFNNLLTVVVASLERLARSIPPEDKERHRAVQNAMQASDRAAALTQQLLAFARKQVLRPVATDANALIRRLVELLHRTLGEGVVMETDLAPDLWVTYTDPNQLENVLLNLAVNSRDAMPEGGTLRIATRNFVAEAADGTEGPMPGSYIAVEVSDSGTGMTKEVAERAFEPFFTTKPLGQGSGLGLSQTYGFAMQSRGHVSLDSAPGRGTTIRLYLPRFDRDSASEAARDQFEQAGAR